MVFLDQRDQEDHLERLVFLVFPGKMEPLVLLEREDLQGNMDLLDLLEFQELLDHQDQPESQDP